MRPQNISAVSGVHFAVDDVVFAIVLESCRAKACLVDLYGRGLSGSADGVL